MYFLFCILFIFQVSINAGETEQKNAIRKKYPQVLLTDDYGVLTAEDLTYEIRNFNENKKGAPDLRVGPYRWQCFPTKYGKFNLTSCWEDDLFVGPNKETRTLCDFNITFKINGVKQFYYDRSARDIEFCQTVKKHFNDLIRGQSYVCMSGNPNNLEDKKEVSWFWNKIKTKRGCFPLFRGECDTNDPK